MFGNLDKLHTGWSSGKPTGTLQPEEKMAILEVIQRNELLETAERQRVGRLVERVEKIKQRAAECGPRYCRLCGQSFGLLGPSKLICDDCQKPVCSKCSIELHSRETTGTRDIWLCKICSETREMWKKTGAWFFKGIPKYEIPQQRTSSSRQSFRDSKLRQEKPVKLGIKCTDTSSEEEDESTTEVDAQKHSTAVLNGRSSYCSAFNVGGNRKHPLVNRQNSATDTQSNQTNYDWETASISTTNRNGRRGSVTSSMSMSETSSANSSNGMGCYREPCFGWLELSVNYSEADHTLDCSLLRARDLPTMDVTGHADPFCKTNIITPYGSKQQKWFATKTVHKTTNPEFNEKVRFLGVEPDELINGSMLYVVILDDDRYGHDFLGAAKINLAPIYSSGPHRMTVPLDVEDNFCVEAAMSGPWLFGQILIALCYNTKRRSLIVRIDKCTNLMAKDKNGFSDPFVKLQMRPDSQKKKFKSSIKWRTLNPIFNEEFAFETRPNDLDKQLLLLTVWDKDLGKSNDFLGSLILGGNSKGRRLKQWKDCIRMPDCFHEQWHCLSGEHIPN
ncbi:Double C2-like domain-containing protein beta [Pseudolycoriella hygida]|uniref:Double C2-like domain-containing protein beta n=1 Tax=Pseudolycoriella hygida TaxID=35572 RepID=A0A9Q0MQU3_9DIPT|nr:Double C2-like domain-containing protein beta [Pseudolycoriella hygida]